VWGNDIIVTLPGTSYGSRISNGKVLRGFSQETLHLRTIRAFR
jgi:hypothetical protein